MKNKKKSLQKNAPKKLPRQPIINWKTLTVLIVVLIAIVLIVPKLVSLQEAIKLLSQVNKGYLLLALVSELISYSAAAWLLGILLSRMNFHLPFKDRFRIGSIAAFAIHFLPIGTFGEGALDYYFLHAKKVNAGSILITLLLRIIITYAAFLTLFFISLLVIPTSFSFSLKSEIAIITVAALTLFGVVYLIYLYKNKEKFKNNWKKLTHLFRSPISRLRGKNLSDYKTNLVFEDIYSGLHLFSRKKRFTVLAILAGLLYWLGDITCFFFVFLSFGYVINFGVLIFTYNISTLAGMISFIPGGLGVTEGSLGLIFNSFSVPLSITLVSILVFRLLSFWIWIPIGLISYVTMAREISQGKSKSLN